jgi:hypothetical protein
MLVGADMVESMIRYSASGSSDIASKIRHKTPWMLRRLKRRLFPIPKHLWKITPRRAVRTIHSTPSTNIRLSRPVEPFWSGSTYDQRRHALPALSEKFKKPDVDNRIQLEHTSSAPCFSEMPFYQSRALASAN